MIQRSAIEQFIEAINSSKDLAQEAKNALDGSADPRRFVELAERHGYKFTQVQAQEYFKDIGEAPPASALSEQQINAVIGAKLDAETPPRDSQLKNALTMLRGMNFDQPPTWTAFSFAPNKKRT